LIGLSGRFLFFITWLRPTPFFFFSAGFLHPFSFHQQPKVLIHALQYLGLAEDLLPASAPSVSSFSPVRRFVILTIHHSGPLLTGIPS
jgi:hypothetical protein